MKQQKKVHRLFVNSELKTDTYTCSNELSHRIINVLRIKENDELIIFNNQKDISTTTKINIDLIEKNPFQPRTNFTKTEITELANSIRTYGLIQPITVRQNTLNKFELISGDRRLRAAKLIGLKEIPVFIKNIQNKNMQAAID